MKSETKAGAWTAETFFTLRSVTLEIVFGAFDIDERVVRAVPRETCLARCVVPVSEDGDVLIVAVPRTDPDGLRRALAMELGRPVEVVIAAEAEIELVLRRMFDV